LKPYLPDLKHKACTILLILFLLTGLSPGSYGQSSNETVFGFLNVPGSARTAALGGEHVSLNSGGTAMFTTNPAYVSGVNHKEFSASYLNHLADIYMANAHFSWHINEIGTFSTGIRLLNYGNITRVDSDGIEDGSFGSYDFSWSAAFSRTIFGNLQGGAGTRIITSSYDTYQSTAIALFGGLYYTFNDDLTHLGVSFRNLGSQLTLFDETREKLPFDLSAGVTHRLMHLPLRFNLTLHSLNRWDLPVFDDEEDPGISENLLRRMRFGTEILFSDNFHLRLGYDHLKNQELKGDRRIDLSGSGIGLGIEIRDISIDLSRTSFSETGGLFQLSLATQF